MSYSDIKPRPRPKTEAEWREAPDGADLDLWVGLVFFKILP